MPQCAARAERCGGVKVVHRVDHHPLLARNEAESASHFQQKRLDIAQYGRF
jgi:hypothetical protein